MDEMKINDFFFRWRMEKPGMRQEKVRVAGDEWGEFFILFSDFRREGEKEMQMLWL